MLILLACGINAFVWIQFNVALFAHFINHLFLSFFLHRFVRHSWSFPRFVPISNAQQSLSKLARRATLDSRCDSEIESMSPAVDSIILPELIGPTELLTEQRMYCVSASLDDRTIVWIDSSIFFSSHFNWLSFFNCKSFLHFFERQVVGAPAGSGDGFVVATHLFDVSSRIQFDLTVSQHAALQRQARTFNHRMHQRIGTLHSIRIDSSLSTFFLWPFFFLHLSRFQGVRCRTFEWFAYGQNAHVLRDRRNFSVHFSPRFRSVQMVRCQLFLH